MPIPLSYQVSEYDCGPTSLLNALNYLFDRKQIRPCLLKAVYQYSLDDCDQQGRPGYMGTSGAALKFLCRWMNSYAQSCHFPIRCKTLHSKDIFLGPGSELNKALEQGAVAVTRCLLGCGHYVLIVGAHNGVCELWDPYYEEKPIRKKTIETVTDEPNRCNHRVAYVQMNTENRGYYSLGPIPSRECLLLWNTGLKRDAEKPPKQKPAAKKPAEKKQGQAAMV
ncbi:MAG: peptidase C39 [Faecalibacterium sp.]|jgi:hypothetical protein|nr:peptidase C39 [Faecalibacterium sp.]